MVLVSERRISLREWRIWPLLTASAGTQLAYAILHMVVKDFFACILTLFAFIGSVCCIVSRRSEVVLANLLLQLVIFTTLFICCCLGTSSMQIWHEDKKLAPLVATQILFLAAVLVLNAILLALKERQRRRDAVPEEAAFANRKLPCRRTESSATMYTRSPSSPHTFLRLQQQRDEQAQSEQGQNHEAYSCCIPVCADAEKSCSAGKNLLYADVSRSMARRNASSLYSREVSGINQQSPDFLGENENEGEASPALTVYKAARLSAGEKLATTSHLVIRSQQIEAAANSQRHSALDPSATLQTVGGRCGRNSCCSATPLIHQQSCTLHGRALYSVSTGEIRTFNGGRRTAQADDIPALPRSAVAENTAAAAAVAAQASPCVCLVDCEHQQNAATVAVTPYPETPRRCLKCHFHDRSMSCSCPQQMSGAFPPSSIPSVHSCVSLHDGGTGCGAASLEQKGLSYRACSAGKYKCFFMVSLKKTVRRCWETTLTYLGQPINCDSVLEAANENPGRLQQSHTVRRVTPSRSTTGVSSPKVEERARREPPEEFLSGSCSLYHCRRTSVEDPKLSAEDTCVAQVMCTDVKDDGKDGHCDGKSDQVEEPEAARQQKFATVRECVRESKHKDADEPSPAVPLVCALQPFKSMHRQNSRNSCVNPAACITEGSTSAADEGSKQMARTHDVGVFSLTEVHADTAQRTALEQNGKKEEGSGHRVSSAASSSPSAAELDTEEVASSGELISKQECVPLEFSPAVARKDNERHNQQAYLDAPDMCEGLRKTDERPRRRSATEVGKDKSLEYLLQSPPREDKALLSSEMMLRRRNTEVFTKLEKAASSVEVIEADNILPQLEKTDNHSSKCEGENKHGVLPTSVIVDTHNPVQGVGTPFSTRYAVPPAETFNRLPSGAIAVDEEGTLHGETAEDAQFSDVGEIMEGCGQVAQAGPNVEEQFPSTAHTAALTVTLEHLPPVCLREEPKSKELLISGQGKPRALVSQPAAPGFTAAGEDSADSENYIFSRNSDKDPLGATTVRDVIVSKFYSETQDHVEVVSGIDGSCGEMDTFENDSVNVRATAEETHTTSRAAQAFLACKGETLTEVKRYDECSAVKIATAAAHNVDDAPVSFTRRKVSTTEETAPVGGVVSREKVVYRDHLTRKLTSNTTPRAEEEDSWEDESEETEGQTQTDVLTRKGGGGGSEWELSDISDAGIRSENRRQGRGRRRTQRSRQLPSEVPAVYGKRTIRKKNRECRTNC